MAIVPTEALAKDIFEHLKQLRKLKNWSALQKKTKYQQQPSIWMNEPEH